MAVLAPIQEGMQALPAEEDMANFGACALRKVQHPERWMTVWPDELSGPGERPFL